VSFGGYRPSYGFGGFGGFGGGGFGGRRYYANSGADSNFQQAAPTNNNALIIGLSVGGALLVVLVVVIIVIVTRKPEKPEKTGKSVTKVEERV